MEERVKTESGKNLSGSSVLSTEGSEPTNRGLVLVADDDPVVLDLLRELLQLDGFRVVTAPNGARAVELLSSEKPQIVIADICMPEMGGLELLGRIRQLDETVPVIMITGGAGMDSTVECLRLGAYDYVMKPIEPGYLMKTVNRALAHSELKWREMERIRKLEDEFRKGTEELANINELLNGILNSSAGVSIVWTDFDQTVRFWNAGAEALFGYSAAEMQGAKITVLYPENTDTPEEVETLRRRIQVERKTLKGQIKQRTKDGRLVTVSLVISPMLAKSGEVLGILGIGTDVTEEVRLQEELLDSLLRIHKVQSSAIFALALLAESRDKETGNHLKRIEQYCEVLCKRLRTEEKFSELMNDRFLEDLVQASVLHDIGKVGIPDRILFSKELFGPEEHEIMKQHTLTGGRALENAAKETGEGRSLLSIGMDVAYHHHERWDGTGYPYGKKCEEIPMGARIVSVADVYDALTAKRRYKRAYSHEEALAFIIENGGRQFDPDVVAVFQDVAADFNSIREQFSDPHSDQNA
jgi:PAS domain S-box-containing protein